MSIKQLKKQGGIGLIELMVSITIGLFILAGVVQLYLTSTQNVSTFEGSSRIQENARYLFTRLEQDLGGAGNLGCFSSAAVRNPQYRIISLLAEQSGYYNFTSLVGGEDAANPGVGGNTATDSLLLRVTGIGQRYKVLDVDETAMEIKIESGVVDNIESGQVMAISDCSSTSIFAVESKDESADTVSYATFTQPAGNPKAPYNVAEDLQGVYRGANSADEVLEGMPLAYVYVGGGSGVVAYEIDTSAAGTAAGGDCGSSTPEYCALKRDGEEIVEGVEDLQIEYGWINDSDGLLRFDEADTITTDQWRMIDRVRVTATFNSINDATTNEGTDLLRRTYSRVYVLYNQLPKSL